MPNADVLVMVIHRIEKRSREKKNISSVRMINEALVVESSLAPSPIQTSDSETLPTLQMGVVPYNRVGGSDHTVLTQVCKSI